MTIYSDLWYKVEAIVEEKTKAFEAEVKEFKDEIKAISKQLAKSDRK